jgi:hypothetical protein
MGQNRIQLGTTADDIEYAIKTVYKMSFLSGRYTRSQLNDLATYIASPTQVDMARGATIIPTAGEFGKTSLSDQSGARYAFSFRNTGFEPLRLSGIRVSGDGFALTGGSCVIGRVLEPSQACKALLLFRPSSIGDSRGQLELQYEDGLKVSAPLTGTGVATTNTARVVEYRHPQLDYFFQTARTAEQELLDGIESFERTGQHYPVFAAAGSGQVPVVRFYFDQSAQSRSRGTHFYTLLPAEIELLRSLNPTNQSVPGLPVDEGIDGYAIAPVREGVGGSCPEGTQPVFRMFRGNQRFPDNPNHRFTVEQRIYDEFVAKGWDGEGIKFCVQPMQP